jgi:ribosomal protein L25 (general stress protein Ctc)
MKFFLSLILLICVSARAQNGDCLKLGETLSIKIDSICLSGWNHSAKPTITIIEYGTLPIHSDTTRYSKSGGTSKVYRINNQILKVVYQGMNEKGNRLEIEQQEIQIYFDKNKPIYIDYEYESMIDERKIVDLKLHFCMEELEFYKTNNLLNFTSIISQINDLIDDAEN